MESTLQERLKRLRERELTSSRLSSLSESHDQGIGAARSSAAAHDHDEIEALLHQARDEVSIDQQQRGVKFDDDHDDEGIDTDQNESDWLAENTKDDEESRLPSRGFPISQKDLHEVSADSHKLTKDAQEALRNLAKDVPEIDATNHAERPRTRLVLEPKAEPVLSRNSSRQEVGTDDLRDELADALASDIGTSSEQKKDAFVEAHTSERDQDVHQTVQRSTSVGQGDRETDDLISRLTQLRAGKNPATGQHRIVGDLSDNYQSSSFFDLPSAPRTEPIQSSHLGTKEEGEGKDGWKARHDVQGRDLSAFEKLVRLDANRLAEPSSQSRAESIAKGLRPAKERKSMPEEEGDPDDWCCICTNDAVFECTGCDDDRYCEACWREGHDTMDVEEKREHRAKHLTRARPKRRLMAA